MVSCDRLTSAGGTADCRAVGTSLKLVEWNDAAMKPMGG